MARTDYAGNAGHNNSDEINAGPNSLLEGDTQTGWIGNIGQYTGVIFRRSEILFSQVKRGTSNTYMAGEKYLDPRHYHTGLDPSDNETMYTGFNNDVNRCTFNPPIRDTLGRRDTLRFGSAHPSGVNMLMCDGSVQLVSYQVIRDVHRRAGDRTGTFQENQPVSWE
jgi:prepilin-type processing-associated H-X9-DG protein